jgi:dipeptidyl aminopeptidase/acylaminoacyl peptidase
MLAFPRAAAFVLVTLWFASAGEAADKRPMKVEDLFKFKRVAAPQISHDGKTVVYQVGTVDLDKNTTSTALWVAATDGKSKPKQLTEPRGKKDSNPCWSPDGLGIVFESNRSGSSQLWVVPPAGGEPKQITDIATGAANPIWSPDGTHIAFTSAVYPEFSGKPFAESNKLNKGKEDAIEKNPVKAKVFSKLFYRHWDEYVGDKRQHIFVCSAEGKDCRDVTPGDRDAYPTSTTFSSGEDFTFTPDSKHLVFTAVPEKEEAWSTNYDICRVSITNTSPRWECLTAANKAADSGPKFSPDGKQLAWRAQKTAGYEADKWDILVADAKPDGTLAGQPVNRTAKADISVNEFCWGPRENITFVIDRAGGSGIWTVTPDRQFKFRITPLHITPLHTGAQFPRSTAHVSSLSASGDGAVWGWSQASLTHPPVVLIHNSIEASKPNQEVVGTDQFDPNEELLSLLDLPRPESVSIPVEGDVKMQMWILKPPGFDPAKKWPVAFLVHGGPQSAWEDGWSNRWNPSLWAAQGYVVALPNPRGSTGFGQKFVDEITGDWGGKCYRDLVAALDYVEALPFVDKDRIGAAGASFGGYMMDWFAVNDISRRFKCLISHCSVWNFESMWGTTDELWFDEWEHQGLPWEKPGKYAEFSPHKQAGNLSKYKTPMLLIQNDLDFRCPVGQGHELFSALQRQGVPSKLINFPDEGHWVLKPRNSQHWHQEVFAWLKKYVPPGGK